MKTLKVLSCIPSQLYSFDDKVNWVATQIATHRPDVVQTPQEWAGGIQCQFFADKIKGMKESYSPEEFTTPYVELAKRTGVGIITGALIDDPILNERRERIYVIDPEKGITGYNDKFALPAYDHIDAHGTTKVFPETNLSSRAVAHELMGSRVSIIFCWESVGAHIWHAISRAQPDWCASLIKFGINGWPQKDKNDDKESVVTGFGFGADGGWLERLHMAAKWDLAAPIICSTNSWNLPNKAGALCGQILPWEEKETAGQYAQPARLHSFFHTLKEKPAGEVMKERVQVDEVDYLYWRFIRAHKFELNGATGRWPASEARAMTMRWKVLRMERKCLGLPKLEAPLGKELKIKAPKGSHLAGKEPGYDIFDLNP